MSNDKRKFQKNLEKLKEIVDWFENAKDVDIEEGLKKVKEGVRIIKFLKARMKEIENEFEEIKKDLEE